MTNITGRDPSRTATNLLVRNITREQKSALVDIAGKKGTSLNKLYPIMIDLYIRLEGKPDEQTDGWDIYYGEPVIAIKTGE